MLGNCYDMNRTDIEKIIYKHLCQDGVRPTNVEAKKNIKSCIDEIMGLEEPVLIPLHCRACTKDIRECECDSVWKKRKEYEDAHDLENLKSVCNDCFDGDHIQCSQGKCQCDCRVTADKD